MVGVEFQQCRQNIINKIIHSCRIILVTVEHQWVYPSVNPATGQISSKIIGETPGLFIEAVTFVVGDKQFNIHTIQGRRINIQEGGDIIVQPNIPDRVISVTGGIERQDELDAAPGMYERIRVGSLDEPLLKTP